MNSNGDTEVSNCIKCSVYENQLREALEELSSLKLINKLLQKEVFAYTNHNSTWEIDRVSSDSDHRSSSISNGVPVDYNRWTLVTSTNRTDKSKTRIEGTTAKFSQPIKTTNRYTPLNKVPNSSKDTIVNVVKKVNKSLSHKETTEKGEISKQTKKKQVIVIGDSHARGCAAELSASLGNSFEVMGTIMPGSGLRHITGLASRETSQLQRNEFVIICGGANDINKNESSIGLQHIRRFALQNKHTNVITISPPHRHDLQDTSCINDEIQVYNRKLHKSLKDLHNVTIIDTNFSREDFTRHGLHMNSAGKEKLAQAIGHIITNFSSRQTSRISLNWKEDSTATPTKEATLESSRENAELELKTAVRTSNRTKKIPSTRKEDFLWPTHTAKTI